MTSPITLPPESLEKHYAISKIAALRLGELVDGNGLKPDQIRLTKSETEIFIIPAHISIKLQPEAAKTQLRGRSPQGIVLGTDAEVLPHAAGLAQGFLAGEDTQAEIIAALKKVPGEGFGMQTLPLTIGSAHKEFSVIGICLKCNGATTIPCLLCRGSGKTPCQTCHGQGFSPCHFCFGVGMMQEPNGNRVPCTHCQHTGRVPCVTCNGLQQLTCVSCTGHGSTPCPECGQSGSMTNVYQVAFKALCTFDVDWKDVPPDVRKVAETLGIKELSLTPQAEVYQLPQEMKEENLLVPFLAFLPIASAEFSVEGKLYPAIVAGLQGRIIEMEPLLDPAVKPGISALMKLSKGPMAVQALIDTACKYKLIRKVLAGLARSSKKAVYQRLVHEYPVVLSDKYARATILYAHKAVVSISNGPRYKGLAAGTGLSAALAALFYLTPARQALLMQLAQRGNPQFIGIADIALWLLGYAAAVYVIKLMTAAAFKKMFPETVALDKAGLPAAGMQGIMALATTALVCTAVAACAAAKPEWMMNLLKH